MKIGLLGGSFDPIHNTHVQMAKYAKKQLGLDEVWFVVANDTPLKNRKLTSFYDRCQMVEMAIAAYRHFKVCTIEVESSGKSYTIDTVRKLKKRYPYHQFYFMIGQDQVVQLDQWKEIDCLLKEVTFCAFARDGKQVETSYPLQVLHMPMSSLSSTSVREGRFLDIHPNVCTYMINHCLYMDFVKEAMSEYRYEHSVSVAKVCVEIAHANHMDVKKAYLCGLLHDINKEFTIIDQTQSENILKIMKPELLNYSKSIWHGYIGRFICAHALKIKDRDILMAIENHVLGACRNRYAMLLYVADKLDPLRDYDTTPTINLCKQSLDKGYKEVKRQQKLFYGEKNVDGK